MRWVLRGGASGSQPLSTGGSNDDLGLTRGLWAMGINSAENVRLVEEVEPAELTPNARSSLKSGGGGGSSALGGAVGRDKEICRAGLSGEVGEDALGEGVGRAMKGSLRRKFDVLSIPPSVMPRARMAGRGFGGGSGWLKRLLSTPRLDNHVVLSDDTSFLRRLWPDFLWKRNKNMRWRKGRQVQRTHLLESFIYDPVSDAGERTLRGERSPPRRNDWEEDEAYETRLALSFDFVSCTEELEKAESRFGSEGLL